MNNTNPPALEVRNLGKSFGKTEVLRGISFTLERGAVLALRREDCLSIILRTAEEGETWA